MSSSLRLSADGLFYWDGRQWVSALSRDGRYRWDGAGWVPIQQLMPMPAYPPQPAYAPVPAVATRPRIARTATSWTRPMQWAVGGLFALAAAWSAAFQFWLGGSISDYMRQNALSLAQANPDLYPDPTQYANTMAGAGTVIVAVAAIIGIAVATVVVIGALRRWTWMHHAVLVLLGFQILGVPYQVALGLGLVQAQPGFNVPGFAYLIGLVLGVIAIALFAWMLVALLRRGPWATLSFRGPREPGSPRNR